MWLDMKIFFWKILGYLFSVQVNPMPLGHYTQFLYEAVLSSETITDNWQQSDFENLAKHITIIVRNNPADVHFSYDADEGLWDDVFMLEPADTPISLAVGGRHIQYKNHTAGANAELTVIAWYRINE